MIGLSIALCRGRTRPAAMSDMLPLDAEQIEAFLIATGIGLLIGLERERVPSARAGLRTFGLVGMLGALVAMLGEQLGSPAPFVAGLVLSIAFITQYIVAGTHWVEAHLQLRVVRWIGLGLLMALATGIASLWFGYPFMTTHTAHLTLPVVGEIHIASALFFDIAVFAVVVGSTLLILTALAHQSVRSHRKAPDKSAAATAAVSAGKVD
jgi:multisubunit Na+/H+ antiporter MnhB subunit